MTELLVPFNGYVVTYWDHELMAFNEHTWPDIDYMISQGWDKESITSAEDFAEDAYEVWGDQVIEIKDLNGKVLFVGNPDPDILKDWER